MDTETYKAVMRRVELAFKNIARRMEESPPSDAGRARRAIMEEAKEIGAELDDMD